METLCDRTTFSNKDETQTLSASVILVNFRRMQLQELNEARDTDMPKGTILDIEDGDRQSRDLFHSIAALYTAALPDMELEAVYGSLTKPSRTIAVLATKESVIEYRQQHGLPVPLSTPTNEEKEKEEEESYDDPYAELFSDSDNETNEDETDIVEDYQLERTKFLERVKERRSRYLTDHNSIGLEDKLIGCLTFMRLSCKPGESSTQIILLAVRHRWRGYGVGGYLMRLSKDPSVVGQYDIVLTYADHQAEEFFNRHGFTDDPIVTARHKKQADYWENSTLMVYIPPYSTDCIGSLKSLEEMNDQLQKWRVMSMAAHCEQVCIMERLRQEILVLQSRLSSQQEVIEALQKELCDSKLANRVLQVEFELYRQQNQAKVLRLMEERAKGWIDRIEDLERDDTESQTNTSPSDKTKNITSETIGGVVTPPS